MVWNLSIFFKEVLSLSSLSFPAVALRATVQLWGLKGPPFTAQDGSVDIYIPGYIYILNIIPVYYEVVTCARKYCPHIPTAQPTNFSPSPWCCPFFCDHGNGIHYRNSNTTGNTRVLGAPVPGYCTRVPAVLLPSAYAVFPALLFGRFIRSFILASTSLASTTTSH